MRPYIPFSQQVDDRLGVPNDRRGSFLELGPTPACLRLLGFPNHPLRMPPSVLWKIHTGKGGERDGLDRRLICQLPVLIDDPVALLVSSTVPGALVVFSSAQLAGGHVVVSVEADRREGNSAINLITSAYAKDREVWLAEQVEAGRLKYWGNKKGFGTLDVSGTTLNRDAEPGSQNPRVSNVLFPEDVVNYRRQLRQQNLSLALLRCD